jgi:hypothetical protein
MICSDKNMEERMTQYNCIKFGTVYQSSNQSFITPTEQSRYRERLGLLGRLFAKKGRGLLTL